MTHKHQLSAGWIRYGETFRECIQCRQVIKWNGKYAQLVKSDYHYYKDMARYYGV